MASTNKVNAKTGLVIMSGNKVVYQAGSTDGIVTNQAPVGKGKGIKLLTKTRASAKGTPEIKNDIFSKCAQLCQDNFWKTHFDNAAFGIFPRGFTYSNGIVIYRAKSKSKKAFYCEINLDPKIAISQFKQFLQERAGVMSEDDTERKQIDLERLMEANPSNNIDSWNSIKTSTSRNIMIGFFVDKLGLNYNLTLKERHNLANLIKLGVSAGYFDSSNIIVNQGQIISIDGLMRDNKNFDIDKINLEPKSKKTSKPRKGKIGTTSNRYDDDITSLSGLHLNSDTGDVDDITDGMSTLSNVNFLTKWGKFLKKLANKSTKEVSTPLSTVSSPMQNLMNVGTDLIIDDEDDNSEDSQSESQSESDDDDDHYEDDLPPYGTQTPPIKIIGPSKIPVNLNLHQNQGKYNSI
jgi:hypothetical protein